MLADWAMMLVEEVEEGDEPSFDPDATFYTASAKYSGVFDGELIVVCQQAFSDILVQNVLGLSPDEEVSDADRKDALQELANVVSGNLLTEAFGTEAVFDLPDYLVGECSFEKVKEYLGDDCLSYLADDEPVTFRLEIDADDD